LSTYNFICQSGSLLYVGITTQVLFTNAIFLVVSVPLIAIESHLVHWSCPSSIASTLSTKFQCALANTSIAALLSVSASEILLLLLFTIAILPSLPSVKVLDTNQAEALFNQVIVLISDLVYVFAKPVCRVPISVSVQSTLFSNALYAATIFLIESASFSNASSISVSVTSVAVICFVEESTTKLTQSKEATASFNQVIVLI